MKKTIDLHKRWKDDPSKGEVFTPEELVKEMLDKIPTSVWENPTSTFLDPCMGKGTFLIDILRRLTTIYGYSKEDAMSRIYGYDVRVKYINYLKRGGFKNVSHKDFLNEKIEMKFDVVVGNPPYQDSSKSQGKNSSLWTKFLIKSDTLVKDNGFITMVTPISWIAPNENQKTNLKNVFNTNNLLYLDTKCGRFFKEASTFSYYVIKKDNNYTTTIVNGENMSLKLNFLPNKLTKDMLSLTNKIFFTFNEKLSFSSSLRNDKFNIDGQFSVWYGSEIRKSNFLGGNYNKLKVVVNKPGYLNPRFDNGLYNTSANNYWVEVDNKVEANNIISFFNSGIGDKIMNKYFKYSGYNSLGVFKSLPKVIKNYHWDDDRFKEVFKLTQAEIDSIYE